MQKQSPMLRLWQLGARHHSGLVRAIVSASLGVLGGMLPYFAAAQIIIGLLSGRTGYGFYAAWCLVALAGFCLRALLYALALSMSHKATFSILKEIRAIYRANGEAVVVVTPDQAGDFIRRQRAVLGLRLSKYLEVLFEHYEQLDVIPPSPSLSAVIAAMESGTADAAAVYAAGNDFQNTLLLQSKSDLDRLPGHLPRTAPAPNEYMGAALFSGPRMTGTLTGNEVSLLCLMTGKASKRVSVIDGAQYKTRLQTRVKHRIDPDGTLFVALRLTLTLSAGQQQRTGEEIAASLAQDCVHVLHKLQAASCDAVGFGRIQIRRYPDIPAWERSGWAAQYESRPVRVSAEIKILQ